MNHLTAACLYTNRCTYKGGTVLEERELIKRVQEGEQEAFEILFNSYKDKALRTVYLMTGDYSSAEDIVQEAFVTCYLSIKGLKNPEYFKTWFYKVLTRLTWRYMKKEKKLIPTDAIADLLEQGQKDTYLEKYQQEKVTEAMYEALLALDKKLQTTCILYYYNGLSIKEIAKVMGCLEGTVKSRLHTIRRKLKGYFEEQQADGVTVHNV